MSIEDNMTAHNMTVQERFEIKYVKDPSGCWLWTACTNSSGYGCFNFEGKWAMAHRVSWELVNGNIKKGMQVLHTCDVPRCVNPSHMFLGTKSDNMKDAVKKKWHNYSKRVRCNNGHILEGNSYVRSDCIVEGRRCKTCHKKNQKKYKATYKAKRKANE